MAKKREAAGLFYYIRDIPSAEIGANEKLNNEGPHRVAGSMGRSAVLRDTSRGRPHRAASERTEARAGQRTLVGGGGPDRGQCEVQSVSRSEKSRLLCMAVMYALEPRGEVTESGEVGRGQITRSSARSGPQVGKNGGSRRFRSLAAATPVRGGVSLS